jgi:hypothetical protein
MNTQTTRATKTKLSKTDLQPGGGVEPGDVPEAARRMRVRELRALGLPFQCAGGAIIEDAPTESGDDIDADDDERESRRVLFKLGDECMSVDYTRPINIAITAKFEPWPNETELLITLYDEDADGNWQMRQIGEESPVH